MQKQVPMSGRKKGIFMFEQFVDVELCEVEYFIIFHVLSDNVWHCLRAPNVSEKNKQIEGFTHVVRKN